MTAIKKLIDGSGNQYFPQTHTNAVVDDNGYSVESRMQAVQDVVNQAQMEIGAVPSDLTPTEDSTNWVTSGGVYNAIQVVQDKLDGYVYNGIETLSVGQLYEKGQNVKTSESNILELTKEIGKLTVDDAIAANTYWVYNSHTYKAVSAINAYDPATTYNDGSLALGSPTEIFFTVTAETPVAGNIDITVGNNSATVAVTSESTAAGIAADIITGIGTIDGWNWTNNEDGSFKLTKSIVGSGTLTATFTDTGSTGVLLSNSSVAGTTKVAIYSNGQWAAATLASMVSSSVFVEQTVDDLYTICQQAALIDDINERWTISKRSVNYIQGHYYNGNGQVRTGANYGYITDYIPITPNTTYSFNSGVTNATAYLCEYSSAKVYKANRQLNAVPKTFTTNADSYYLRVSFPLSQVENVWLKDSLGNIIWQAITPANVADASIFNERITPLEDVLAETEVEARVLKAYTSRYYIMANPSDADYGNALYYTNADYACTPFIDISGYDKFSVTTLTSSVKAGAGTVVYDTDKVPIKGYYKALSSGYGSYTATGTLPENAKYIRVSCWSSSFSGGYVVLHLWDTLKEFTIRKTADLENRVSELEATGVPAGATMYDYVGEKIVIDLPKYTGSSILTMSLTGTGQGGTVFGDYYFVGTGGNAYINVYNLSSKTKLAAIVPNSTPNGNTHDNTMCFSNQYYDENDQFPILYISSGHADTEGNTQAYGYRITNTNNTWAATLVHTITLISGWSEFLIDNIRQKAWIKTGGNWYCTNMPQYIDGDVTIDVPSLTPEFKYPAYSGSAQGHLFYNDKIYFPAGTSSESAKNLYVLNTKTGKYDSIVDLHSVSGNDEPENVFIYNGYLHVGYRSTVIRLYFN